MPYLPPASSIRRHLTTVAPQFIFKNPNHNTLSILQSCKSIQELEKLHAQLITTGQIKDTYIATKVVESFAVSARNIDYAYRVFDGIDRPDSYAWTTMIRGFVEMKNPEKAIEFYGLMSLRGVQMNRFTFLFVLKAYALRLGCIEGRIVHGKVVKVGFCFDAFLSNALIHMYSKCGDIGAAYQVFDEMNTHNVVNWNTMIMGYFHCGDADNGRRLFDEMPQRNVNSWNAVIGGWDVA
ncbi:hypothetical protein L1049_020028 [Liquidambar formosana]|uniref:Pentatricopeptide repeat-containing protein n=1 Tax=Liquidambar formosana TaxID=63359 RepID=A0AAP0X9K3_LIQFO